MISHFLPVLSGERLELLPSGDNPHPYPGEEEILSECLLEQRSREVAGAVVGPYFTDAVLPLD